MKADGSLKSLLQGVSQQPTRDRLPGQCTEQLNMSANPVKGLTRRPGDDLVGMLGDDSDIRGWGEFQTQDGRKFLMKITETGPQVFDYNSNQYPVDLTGDLTYWSVAGRWSVATLKLNTYIANSGVLTAMGANIAAYINTGTGSQHSGIIQVLGGGYGKRYAVSLDGVEVISFRTPDGSSAGHSRYIGTAYLAGVINTLLGLPAGGTLPVGGIDWNSFSDIRFNGLMSGPAWSITTVEDILFITNSTPGYTYGLTISDDNGNINAKALTISVPNIADLPRFAPHGYAVRVATETDPEDDLWLKFVVTDYSGPDGGGFGRDGAWYETVAPGVKTDLNASTMPRVLTWNPTTQRFAVGEGAWAGRGVGTEVTNPTPSFIGYGINDLTVFQSRLVFLAGANVIGSRSKRPENFFVGSASTLVDSDPIDLTSQAAFASTLEFAVPHNKDLVIFSPRGQFVLFGRSAVTPSNAALVLTTSFEADLTARPVPCGRNVFFATKYGRFTGVREFFTEGGTDINDTRPITSHVNEYIIGGPLYLNATSNYDTLLVHTTEDKKKVYPYQFIWSDQEKIQSAWSTWTFPNEVVYSFFDDELIYLVELVDGHPYLIRLSLDVYPQDGLDYHLHISNRFDVFGVNSAFLLPYDWIADNDMIVIQGAGCPYPGLPVRILSAEFDPLEGGIVVTIKGDMGGGDIIVGNSYKSLYKPTMPRMKDGDGVVISDARLQITQFLVSCEETGNIIGQKLSKWAEYAPVEFQGYLVNSPSSLVGRPALDDYIFKMPFKERSDRGEVQFYTEDHWPMTLLDIEWAGTINKRGKRIIQGQGR